MSKAQELVPMMQHSDPGQYLLPVVEIGVYVGQVVASGV